MANINADEDESFLKIKHKVEVSQHQLTKCTPQDFQDWWFAICNTLGQKYHVHVEIVMSATGQTRTMENIKVSSFDDLEWTNKHTTNKQHTPSRAHLSLGDHHSTSHHAYTHSQKYMSCWTYVLVARHPRGPTTHSLRVCFCFASCSVAVFLSASCWSNSWIIWS